MEKENLFDQIVKLEKSSEEMIQESLLHSNQIKEQGKKDLALFMETLSLEKKVLTDKLEQEFQEEQKKVRSKNDILYLEYADLLEVKYKTSLEQVVKLFIETNLK